MMWKLGPGGEMGWRQEDGICPTSLTPGPSIQCRYRGCLNRPLSPYLSLAPPLLQVPSLWYLLWLHTLSLEFCGFDQMAWICTWRWGPAWYLWLLRFTALNGGPTQPFSHWNWGARNRAYLSSVSCRCLWDLPGIDQELENHKAEPETWSPDSAHTLHIVIKRNWKEHIKVTFSREGERAVPCTTMLVYAVWAQRWSGSESFSVVFDFGKLHGL